jgi:hypothetical protein
MVYKRDPMSVRFDPAARRLIGRVIARFEAHQENPALSPWQDVSVPNLAFDFGRDKGGLSVTERAFLRALYYDSRIHQLTARAKPDARWSLKAEWDQPPLIPGTARGLRVRVFRDTQGARHAKRMRQDRKFSENPELQSAAPGSPKNRFGE